MVISGSIPTPTSTSNGRKAIDTKLPLARALLRTPELRPRRQIRHPRPRPVLSGAERTPRRALLYFVFALRKVTIVRLDELLSAPLARRGLSASKPSQFLSSSSMSPIALLIRVVLAIALGGSVAVTGAAFGLQPQAGKTSKTPASAPAKPASAPAKPSAEDAEAMKKGLVKFGDSWVTKEDLPFLKEGKVKVDGEWLTKDEKSKLDAGWKRQDLEWVSPEDQPKMAEGLFKVGDKWLSAAEADSAHASASNPWKIPGKHTILISTLGRDEIVRLLAFAENAATLTQKILGKQLPSRITVRVFATTDEANEFGQQFAADHSSIWPGYVAERDPERLAVCSYDKDFAHLYVAHAAAHKAIDVLVPEADKLADWFLEGLVTYVERFSSTAYKEWAIQQLVRRGGISKLDDHLKKMVLSVEDIEGSQTRLYEAGITFAYFIETPEKSDEEAFKKAIASLSKPQKDRMEPISKLLHGDLEKRVRKYSRIDK